MTVQLCSTSGQYLLYFGGFQMGKFVVKFKSTPRLVTEVQVRQNFYANFAFLDHHYPCVVWEHTFDIYDQASDREQIIEFFFELANAFSYDTDQSLLLKRASDGSTAVNFDVCAFTKSPAMQQPTDLLLYQAGIYQVEFLGALGPGVA